MEISACLIGEDSLLIQCGNILLARNHSIKLVVSPLNTIQAWAEERGILCFSKIEQLIELESFEVDYLFSIVNSRILPSIILNMARCHAINYHDSPLPKYAGLNATSWAILNDEKEHGVTWHVMNDHVDEGAIASQRLFPIYLNDTALTLNLRCYENAIAAFSSMIDSIETGKLSLRKQALKDRSYFSINHHLPSFGFIDWLAMSAEVIDRLSRALTLGNYQNNIGSLKLLLQEDYVIVSQLISVGQNTPTNSKPGCILALGEDGILIATKTIPIKITHVLSKQGKPITLSALIENHSLNVGDYLPYFNTSHESLWKEYERNALRSERYWIKIMDEVGEHNAFPPQSLQKNAKLTALIPTISLFSLFPNKEIKASRDLLLTVVLIYLYRLNDHEKVSVSLVHPHDDALKQQNNHLFSYFLPFLFDKSDDFSLQNALDTVCQSLTALMKHPFILSDITARHPALTGNRMDPGIVINFSGKKRDYPLQENTLLYFNIDYEKGEIEVLHRMDLSFHGAELNEIIPNCTQHLLSILIKMINHPFMSARSLCFLTPAERYNLLHWGKGKGRYLPKQSLAMLFEKQVKQTPDKIAVYFGEQKLSYIQLASQAAQIAAFLSLKKLPASTLIGIYLNRSIEMMAVILGILKAGFAYVPLDTKYPLLKIEQIVEDASLSHLFIEEEVVEPFEIFFKQQNKSIELFQPSDILKDNQQTLEATFTNDKLAYIMFTSGTTGRPKGVMVTEENIINYCFWFSETTQFNEDSIIDFSSSIAFDLSVPCTLAPLLAGGSIAIATNAQKANPLHYLNHLKTHKITHTELTPGYLEMLLNHPTEVSELVDLHYLMLGADVVPTNEVIQWLNLCPWHQVVNEYGPTETTVSATSYFVDKDALVNEASVPIGRPAFNTTCYVLDKYKNLCPAGIKGELYIGGAQVTKGYLNRSELTQEKFTLANFTADSEMIYKTGDMVCWLPDGNLQFFGRNDHQVKIQGYRIELPAIEAVLTKMTTIHQAIVVVMTGSLKENYLRAYLITDNKHLSSTELRDFAAGYLPPYMIPREFCAIKAIPLKDNEKIDFTALEKQSFQLLAIDAKPIIELHLTPTEQIVKGVWEKVFHTTLTIEDDFFQRGGDSLMAMQMMSELKTQYDIQLPLQLLFEHPTIASLAQQLDERLQSSDTELIIKKTVKPIIKLASGKEGTPLFLVHPVGGSIFWYKQLAAHLEGKFTIYGIQDVSLEGINLRFNTLEEMATFYLDEIKKVYSGDRFCLGGASFGATVAFEMAHQLIKDKKSLQFLGLFDGWAHYPKNIIDENTLDWLSHTDENHFINQSKHHNLDELEHYRKELLKRYQLSILPTNATLFKAEELWPSFIPVDDTNNGWGPYIQGEIVVHKIPGNHESMFFEPHVGILANHLQFR